MAYPSVKSHNALLVIRGIAILSILWFHIVPLDLSLSTPLGRNLSHFLLIDGMSAVWILLILSGYLMGKKFLSKNYRLSISSIGKFYWNRLLKIVPAYYLVLFVILIYFKLPTLSLNDLIKLLTFQDTQLSLPYALDNLWYISLLVQLYLLFPFIWFITQYLYKKSFRLLVFISLLFPVLSFIRRFYLFITLQPADPTTWTILFHKQTLVLLDLFVAGILLNYLILFIHKIALLGRWLKNKQTENWLKGFGATAFVFLMFLSANTLYRFHHNYPGTALYYATLLPVIIMVVMGLIIVIFEYFELTKPKISASSGFLGNFHPLTFLAWIGTLSYEIYLVHSPIVIASTVNQKYSLICLRNCTLPVFMYHFGSLVILSVIAGLTIKGLFILCKFLVTYYKK